MEWPSYYWADKAAFQQDAILTGGNNNAYFLANQCINNQKRDRIYGNVTMKADIIKGLDLTVRGGLDVTSDFRTQRQATSSKSKPNGWYREQDIDSKQYSGSFLFKYNTRFAHDFHLTANFGGSIIWRSYSNHSQRVTALKIPGVYSLANAADEPLTSNSGYERQTNSLYGMVSLSWRNAIFLDVTGRNDWSSTLPKDNCSFFYPSVSGKWVEKEEDLALTDLTPHCNYRPSQEVSEAIKGATIGWATAKDEGETEPTDDNTNTGGEGGGNTSGGELEG
jgi:hypothetical protein